MSGLFKKRLDDSAESRMEHPASKSWIFFTFLLAFVLCIVFGEIFWAPDFVALTLIFWTLREPDRVGFFDSFHLRHFDGRPIWNRTWPAVTCLRHALLPDIRLIAPFT